MPTFDDNELGSSIRTKLNNALTKVDGIEDGATDDQTGAEIKALYELEPSAFTDAQFTKLAGIETGATADQTGAEIKALYEVEANAFTDAQFTKLAGIETGATADQTDAEIKTAYENNADTNAFTDADESKLDQVMVQFDTVADLLADTNTYAVGTYVHVKDGDFTYKVVASGGDVQNSASTPVEFDVIPSGEGYNLKAFGAKGDDSTDDATALLAWLAAGDTKGKRYAPAGTYLTSKPLPINTQVEIYGEGITTVFKAITGWNPTVPTITPGSHSPVLAYAPIFYTPTPIQWWSMHDFYIDGNDEDCYGMYLNENFYGTETNIFILNCNQRPYTNIRGQNVTRRNCVAYQCNDGVLTFDNTNFIHNACGFERINGEWYYDQRQPNPFNKGGVKIIGSWFEGTTGRNPTEGFLRMSGRRNFADVHMAFFGTATTERAVELNDDTSSPVIDGINMQTVACEEADIILNNVTGSMSILLQTDTKGNNVSGWFTASNVTDSGTGNSFNVNASLSTSVPHITGRFQVRYPDTGSGIPIGSTNYVMDVDYNGGTERVLFFGNANNKIDKTSGNLRITSNLGQRFVATNGTFDFNGSSYSFTGSSGATGYQKPIFFGSYSLWVDSSGRLRIKSGAPASDTDGTVVGTQT